MDDFHNGNYYQVNYYNTYNVPPISMKNWLVTVLLCVFVGGLGIHRFYVGKIGTGILWLFTGGCFGIGWIVDLIKICCGVFRDSFGCVIKPDSNERYK